VSYDVPKKFWEEKRNKALIKAWARFGEMRTAADRLVGEERVAARLVARETHRAAYAAAWREFDKDVKDTAELAERMRSIQGRKAHV